MKVILLGTVANLGSLGDIVEVKNGYARNYLIPQGKARRATEANLQEFALKKAEYEKAQADILAVANLRHDQINEQLFTVSAKAGVDGKLFGSITSMDIAEAITNAGVAIKRSEVSLPNGPLKTIGEFEVDIRLHHDVISKVKINVVAEA